MRLAPGIRIVDLPAAASDGLPVMDVPVFVGFAERGPLDRPVAIEDPAHYLAIFGGPLDLVARDPTPRAAGGRPPTLRAHLPAAVASFLAGGGRRCYVIRVADRGAAQTSLFPVCGLRLAVLDRDAGPARWRIANVDFRLRASSPGTWADRYELAVRLRSTPLNDDDTVAAGDLLRLRAAGSPLAGWLRVASPGRLGEALALASADGWLWTTAGEAMTGLPPDIPPRDSWLVERIGVDLALRHAQLGEVRREDCGLTSGAANLPWFEADAAGRFDAGEELPGAAWPLAGVPTAELARPEYSPDGARPLDPQSADWMLLPLAIDAFFGPWLAAESDGRDALSRNGLASYSAGLFTDPGWDRRLRGSELLRWADDQRYLGASPRALLGLHAALGREDVLRQGGGRLLHDATWIAVPDAVHPGWQLDTEPPRRNGRLLSTPDEPCNCQPLAAFDSCETPPPRIPRPPRIDLDSLRPGPGAMPLAAADREWLIVTDDPASPPDGERVSFEVEIAGRPDFSDRRPLAVDDGELDPGAQWSPGPGQPACAQPSVGPGPRHFAPARYALRLPAGLHFLRARAWRAGRYSEWSETAEVRAVARGWRELPDGFADGVVDTVHRALLDLCAATREHFALLSVPERWSGERLARHVAALREHASTGFAASAATSFAAIHHPWLLRREPASDGPPATGDPAGELHAHPPEAAVLAVYARRTRDRGAWAAASLDPLSDAVALSGEVTAEEVEAASANPIEVRVSGIAATRAWTLCEDPDWQAIGVRRLFILLRRLARREGERFVFEPNDLSLRRSLERSFGELLQRLLQRGAFRGASAAECYALRSASGTRASEEIERGECSLEIRVAPSRPLRFLTLRVLRTGEQLVIEEI